MAKATVLRPFTIAVPLAGHPGGSEIQLPCHKGTTVPVDVYWRKRLKDAQVDGCITCTYADKKKIVSVLKKDRA